MEINNAFDALNANVPKDGLTPESDNFQVNGLGATAIFIFSLCSGNWECFVSIPGPGQLSRRSSVLP